MFVILKYKWYLMQFTYDQFSFITYFFNIFLHFFVNKQSKIIYSVL